MAKKNQSHEQLETLHEAIERHSQAQETFQRLLAVSAEQMRDKSKAAGSNIANLKTILTSLTF